MQTYGCVCIVVKRKNYGVCVCTWWVRCVHAGTGVCAHVCVFLFRKCVVCAFFFFFWGDVLCVLVCMCLHANVCISASMCGCACKIKEGTLSIWDAIQFRRVERRVISLFCGLSSGYNIEVYHAFAMGWAPDFFQVQSKFSFFMYVYFFFSLPFSRFFFFLCVFVDVRYV